ncbi:MAG TPA: hypothetical protein DCS91_16075 [Microcoleaceae bacterium UBA11344]|nr:hypothetical protein [Microcoleaceae cyanobacterium UBA11344]
MRLFYCKQKIDRPILFIPLPLCSLRPLRLNIKTPSPHQQLWAEHPARPTFPKKSQTIHFNQAG